MDILRRIHGRLLAARSWVRRIRDALEDTAEPAHRAPLGQSVGHPKEPIRVIGSFDEETRRRTQTEGDRQHSVLNSTRWATWCAFGAALIYAFISAMQWHEMIKQSRFASVTLRQSIESFRVDERAWVELEPIKATPFSARTEKIGASFSYPIQIRNFGKTVARGVTLRASRNGTQSSIAMGDSAEQIAWEQDKLLLGKVPTAAEIPILIAVPSVLAPNTSSPVPAVLYGQEPQYFPNGQWVSYIVGRVDYTDTFGVPHWVKFCFFVANPRGELWNCKEGNDEDRNPEMPSN